MSKGVPAPKLIIKVSVPEFQAYKAQFVFDVKATAEKEEIPKELIINWDHTGIHYVPMSNWTMAKEGSKRIEISGIDDKWQVTAVLANTMSGDFLSPQIINFMQGRLHDVSPLLNSLMVGI